MGIGFKRFKRRRGFRGPETYRVGYPNPVLIWRQCLNGRHLPDADFGASFHCLLFTSELECVPLWG